MATGQRVGQEVLLDLVEREGEHGLGHALVLYPAQQILTSRRFRIGHRGRIRSPR
jgi:hypothetical protein